MKRDKWSTWLGTVSACAAALAVAVPIAGWPTWLISVFVVVALGAFIGVLATGPIELGRWQLRTHLTAALRPGRARGKPVQALPVPAVTTSWRFTTDGMRHPQLARLAQNGFSHPAYSRPIESTPNYVRVKALVACSQLGETAGWQDLRGRFLGLVTHEWMMSLISELTVIREDATWRSRATGRRTWLEADLTGQGPDEPAVASAKLLLPEAGSGLLGTDRRCAELTLHIDLIPSQLLLTVGEGEESVAIIQGLPFWRRQITRALTMPGDLDGFLRHDLGLTTTDDPPAQFGILLKAREAITDIVSPGNIRALTAVPSYILNEYTAFAIADEAGDPVQVTAGKFMLDLAERVLHLDGSPEEMSGLINGGRHAAATESLEQLRKLAVQGQVMAARIPPPERRFLTFPPADLQTSFESWQREVRTELRSRPELLAQFESEPATRFMENRASVPLWRTIEHRTSVLAAIVNALEGRA